MDIAESYDLWEAIRELQWKASDNGQAVHQHDERILQLMDQVSVLQHEVAVLESALQRHTSGWSHR